MQPMGPPPTGSWWGQKQKFPQDYADMMADWIVLEPVSLRRDAVLREVATLEMLQQGQMAMGPQMPGEPFPAMPPTSGATGDLPALPWPGQQEPPPV
jgi:hypothetical protein